MKHHRAFKAKRLEGARPWREGTHGEGKSKSESLKAFADSPDRLRDRNIQPARALAGSLARDVKTGVQSPPKRSTLVIFPGFLSYGHPGRKEEVREKCTRYIL